MVEKNMGDDTGWELLDEPRNPIPGDPDTVAKLGKNFRSTANSIKRQAAEIKALYSTDAWDSDAAE